MINEEETRKKYENLKKSIINSIKKNPQLKDQRGNYENKIRELFLLSILLKDDCKDTPEIRDIILNYKAPDYKDDINLENKSISINKSEEYNQIMQNIKKYKKIFVSSYATVDSKLAVESIIREALSKKIINNRDEIKVIEIEPGLAYGQTNNDNEIKKYNQYGLYLNTRKEKSNFGANDIIYINSDERLRENSISSKLEGIGFKFPPNITKYVNARHLYFTDNPKSLFNCWEHLSVEQLYELCEEAKKQGKSLENYNLSDEQIKQYNLNNVVKSNDELFSLIKSKLKFVYFDNEGNISKEKNNNYCVGIYQDGKSREEQGYSSFLSYFLGANLCISISDKRNNDEKGVTYSIQSNPKKGDIPIDLRMWQWKNTLNLLNNNKIKTSTDVLNTKTRIVVGGNTKPNVYQPNNKSEILNEIFDKIQRNIKRKNEIYEEQELQDTSNNMITIQKAVKNAIEQGTATEDIDLLESIEKAEDIDLIENIEKTDEKI